MKDDSFLEHGPCNSLSIWVKKNAAWPLHFTTHLYMLSCFSRVVQLFAIPWTVAHQDPLSMEFSRQEYWSGLPCPSPGDLPTQGLNTGLLHCRQILYHLSYREVLKNNVSLTILKKVYC